MASLFDPIVINGLELKNRIVMAPMATNMATPEGRITERHIRHYTARAEGGVGLVILEHTYVAVEGKLARNQTGLYDDSLIPDLKQLVDAIHKAGAKVIIQLTHAGARTTRETIGSQPLGPSAIVLPDGIETPKALTVPEIKSIVTAFIAASRRAIEAGCDGVELHGAHGFLLNQFISPYTNHRDDEYGGNLENRVRFATESIGGVKDTLGGKPFFYRFGADDMIEGGMTPEEGQEVAPLLEKAGVNVLDISGGLGVGDSYGFTEQGFFVPLAEGIKSVVNVPVIGVGNITEPEFADRIVRESRVDLVAIGRKLLADPYFPRQAAEKLGKDLDK
ncbi:MAG: NADH:flavin oxidoreductase [Dehalococcoidales bacterium]|nr:MAG: NADH:flavin oxidoreductase [Dehalococcoidales bacterium]